MIDVDRIREIAERARVFLEPRWAVIRKEESRVGDELGLPLSWRQCRRSSAFLKNVLQAEFPDIAWRVEGGKPSPWSDDDIDLDVGRMGGYFNGDGWSGHYWVVDDGFEFVVDITADQFGAEQIIVLDQPSSNHRANFTAAAVDEHIRDVKWRVDDWLDDWRSEKESSLSPPLP